MGCRQQKIPVNPVNGIKLRIPKISKTRSKGYTDAEARIVRSATLLTPTERISLEHASGRRWIPWLCAYSGARVGEIGQLRAEDVKQVDGVWVMWVTPEAGSTKDKDARHVAIHPHLIEQGFLDFVRGKGRGPLFYDKARSRGGSMGNPQYKKVGERIANWVRSLGIDDPILAPNHAWRHRFKTIARKVKMDSGARDYMQGHVPATEGEAYGDFEMDVLLHEVSKLPRYTTS